MLTPAETMSPFRRLCALLAQPVPLATLVLAALCSNAASANDQQLPGIPQVLNFGPAPHAGPRYFKTAADRGRYLVTADFRGLSGDALSIRFHLEQAAARNSMQAFGVSQDELDVLRERCQATRGCNQQVFDQHLMRYYREHKLRLRSVPGQRSRLFVDIPEVVRHNRAHVLPVSAALRRLASERGHDAEDLFESAVALVQTGLAYRTPSAVESGRQTLGFYTPPRALEKGYGDCDTKSALLAAIVKNLDGPRLIGVRVPGHYLLGIARTPGDNDAYVEYRGESFVLLEAAGPAPRRPGSISEQTRTALATGQELRIDPMF